MPSDERSAYGERPWLSIYPEGLPATIEPEFRSGLELFRAAARRAGDRPLVRYFDTVLTLTEVVCGG